MLKSIHAKGKPGRGGEVSKERTAGKLSNMKFGKAAELVRSGSEETFSHHGFPALSIGNESEPITDFDKDYVRRSAEGHISSALFRMESQL